MSAFDANVSMSCPNLPVFDLQLQLQILNCSSLSLSKQSN